jgi:hypothetical protein
MKGGADPREGGHAMRISLRSLKVAFGVASTLLGAVAVAARMPVPLARDVGDALAGPMRAGEHVVVPRLTLDDGSAVSLDLEAFEVFAPGVIIIEYTDRGPRRLAPPADRYFRGSVIGDLDSLVVLASGPRTRGFVYTKGKVYAVAPDRNVYADGLPDPVARVRMIDPEGDRPPDMPLFHCDTELLPTPPPESTSVTAFAMPISVQPMWTSTVYTVNLAIETDYELRQQFTSTDAEVRYLGDLTAAASAIYWRDVKTAFQIGTVHLWTTSSDPWNATDIEGALDELGDYWHANYSGVARTTVHLVSGKNLGGGIAWLGVLCRADFQFQVCDANGQNCVTHWGGAYGLSGNHIGQFSTTAPAYYWDIFSYTHEIGHNFNSPHTHCYPTPIDHCYNSESGCYSGPLCQNGTGDPCNIGTIMSYCHLRSGGYNNITLAFGQQGQLSQQVLDTMRGYVESKAACLTLLAAAPTVTGISPNVGAPSGGTAVTISGTGFQNMATVTIGGVNATNVTFVNSATITATTGAHAAGTVDVVVQNPDSQTGTLTNGYVYRSCTAPSAPVLTAAASATSGSAYTVSWTATSSDNTYELQESTDPGFGGASAVPVTGTSTGITHTVASAKTYYYRVRAVKACSGSNFYSGWSSTGSTTVSGPAGCAVSLASQTISTTQIYASCNTLTAGPAVQIAAPGDVKLRAAVAVVFRNGLSVQSGARLSAGTDASLGQ